jgi:hypothetical protein
MFNWTAALADGANSTVVKSGAAPAPPPPAGAWMESIHPTSDRALVFAVIALSIATLVSVATAFYLYRWRRIILAKPYLLSPEHLAAQVLALEDRVAETARAHAGDTARLEAASREAQSALERMVQTHMALQPKLDEKDREIQKLRNGLEASLFKRFVRRFVRADLSLTERIKSGSAGTDSLQAVSALLEDALAESGVERFLPPTGIDYRHAEGVADNPELIPTADETKAFIIAEVRRPGYRFMEGAGDRIVIPAEVTVYEFKQTATQESGEQ